MFVQCHFKNKFYFCCYFILFSSCNLKFCVPGLYGAKNHITFYDTQSINVTEWIHVIINAIIFNQVLAIMGQEIWVHLFETLTSLRADTSTHSLRHTQRKTRRFMMNVHQSIMWINSIVLWPSSKGMRIRWGHYCIYFWKGGGASCQEGFQLIWGLRRGKYVGHWILYILKGKNEVL